MYLLFVRWSIINGCIHLSNWVSFYKLLLPAWAGENDPHPPGPGPGLRCQDPVWRMHPLYGEDGPTRFVAVYVKSVTWSPMQISGINYTKLQACLITSYNANSYNIGGQSLSKEFLDFLMTINKWHCKLLIEVFP